MPQSSRKTASIPKPESPSTRAARVKSLIRNILLASPYFPRLYADVVISSAPNSNEAKILARNYKKIVELTNSDVARTDLARTSLARTNLARTNLEKTNRTNMPIRHTVKVCTHIKVTGVRCGSPSLRGEEFCYFHQRMLRSIKGPDTRVHHVALLENEEAIQVSLMEVVNALIRGTIELKRGELILRALNTAVRNIRRARFGTAANMVTQVPDYADPPERAEPPRAGTASVEPDAPARTTHVGTDASVRPAGPELPGRSDPSPKKNAQVDPTRPKPPASYRSAQVLQSRQQRAPSG